MEVSPCRTCGAARRGGTVSRRGVPRDFLLVVAAAAAAAVGTRNYSIFRDGRSQSLRRLRSGMAGRAAALEYERRACAVARCAHIAS